MDIITMLKEDHIKVKHMLEQLANTTERAHRTRIDVLAKIEEELRVHMRLEQDVLYPAVKAGASKEGVELANEAYAEHEAALDLLGKLKTLSTSDEMWKATFTVFQENIEHHVKEEEDELFAHAKRGLPKDDLEMMADRYNAMKAARGEAERDTDDLTKHAGMHIIGMT